MANRDSVSPDVEYSEPAGWKPRLRIWNAVLIAGVFAATVCAFADEVTLSPNTANIAAGGGSGSVQVQGNQATTRWTASVDQSWVTITSATSGTGPATITYTVAGNPAAVSRTAILSVFPIPAGVGNGDTLVITQLAGALNVSPASANAQPTGDSGTVTVNTEDSSLQWTASSSDSSWLKVTSGATGIGPGAVQWMALPNQSSTTRVATIIITPLSGSGQPFTVTQAPAPIAPAITVSPSSLSLDAVGGTGSLQVTATLPTLTWSAVSNSPSWLTITGGSPGTGNASFQYNATGNPSVAPRTASITVTPTQGTPVTVSVTQSGSVLSISPTSATTTAAGGGGTVTITATAALGWTASSNSTWLTITPGAGTGNGSVRWTAAANTTTEGRTATISITPTGGTPQTSTVYQAAGTPPASLTVSPTMGSAPASISNGSITVTATPSSLTWSAVSSNTSWLTINPVNGTGSGPIQYTATGNPTAVPRTATITVTPLTGTPATFTLTQAAGVLTITPTSANPPGSGGTGSIAISTNNTTLQWTAVSSDTSWLTITSAASGTSDATLSWAAAANPSTSHRTATISITPSGGSPLVFTVDQQGLSGTISTSPANITFSYQQLGSAPAAVQLTVNGSGGALPFTAAVASGGSWLAIGGASGNTPSVVNVSVNPTGLAVGAYPGSITITSAAATNSPVTVSVLLKVTAAAVLTATPNALSFSFQQNGPNPGSQTVSLGSSGAPLDYSISVDPVASWLNANGPGPTPTTLTVSVNPTGLAPGTYQGNVILTSGAAGNSPFKIPVTLTVTASPNLVASPASLAVSYRQLAPNPTPTSLTITSSGSDLAFTTSVSPATPWLSVSSGGQTPSTTVQVSINPAGLAIGTYQGSVILTSTGAGNNPLKVPVTLTVAAAPNLTYQPQQLNFAVTQGGASTTASSTIALSSDPRLDFTAAAQTSSGGNWLSVTSSGPQTLATLTVTAQAAGLASGTYNGSIVITAARAGNSPVTIPVTLTVSPQPQLTVTPTQLSFSYQLLSGSNPSSQSFTVSTADHTNVSAVASVSTATGGNWLLAGEGGITPTSLRIGVDPSNLPAGTYSGTVTVSSPGYISAMVPVTLIVSSAPTLNVNPASLNFAIQLGVTVPLPQSVSVTSTPSLSFSATSGAGTPWLTVTGGGQTPAAISVSVNPQGLAVGVYDGTVAVSSSQAGNSPVLIPVRMKITAGPPINSQPTALNFTFTPHGTLPPSQVLSITSSQMLSFSTSVSSSESWLLVSGSGPTPAGLTVSIDPGGLEPGSYSASIIISSPGAANDPLTIPVTLTVNPVPLLTPSLSQLTFSYQTPGPPPPNQTLTVTSNDPSLVVTSSTDTSSGGDWLRIAGGGNIPAVFTISVNPSGLAPGTYQGTITLSAQNAGNSPLTIPVTLVVVSAPILSSSPTQLFFSYQIGNTAPAGAPLQISSSQGTLSFQASASTDTGGPWLQSSAGVTTPGTVTITVNPTGLAAGVYTGSVVLTAGAAGNSPLSVPVTLTVSASAVLTAAPNAVQFVAQQNGSAPGPQTVHIMSGSANIGVTYMTSPGTTWLSFTGSPNSPGDLSISVSQTGLAAGRYSGAVIVKSDAAANSPLEIPVTLDVSVPPVLTTSPSVLQFSYVLLGTKPVPQSVNVNSSGTPLDFTASAVPGSPWLFCTGQGTSPGTVSIAVDPGALTAGTYQGSVAVTSSGSNVPVQVPVILTISSAPTISAQPTDLAFAYQVGASLPAARSVLVSSDSGSPIVFDTPLSFNGGNWLVVSGGGPTPTPFTITAVPTGLQPGVYKSQVSFSAQGVSNSPLVVPVTLTVSAAPTLIASPTTLTFASQVNGATPPNQQFVLTSSDGSPVPIGSVTTSQGGSFLNASIDAGSTPATVTVSISPAGLTAGVYQASVIVSSASAGNNPLVIPVTLTVSAQPSLTVPQTGVTFAYAIGGGPPPPISLNIGSTGAPLVFTSSVVPGSPWLTLTGGGTTPAAIQLSANPAGLAAGTYYGTVLLYSPGAGNNPLQIGVGLIVTGSPLLISAPAAISFLATPPFTTLAQALQITSSGGTLSYTLSTSPSTLWLSVGGGGDTPGSVVVTANPAGLSPGVYSGSIQVVAGGAGNSPLIVPVNLTVQQAASLQANPSPLSFSYSLSGNTPAPQTIALTVGNQPAGNIKTTVGAGSPWLSVKGAAGGALTVAADPTGLLPGTYTGTVVVAADGAGNSPLNVPVTLVVIGTPTFDLSQDSIALTALAAQSQPVSSTIILTSGQNPPVQFDLNVTASTWLTVSPVNGQTPATVTVTADPTGLRPGDYAGSVIVSSNGTVLHTVGVNLTIATAPTFSVAPSFLVFRYAHGGNPPSPVNIVIGRFGADISVVATPSDPWISVNPSTPTTVNPITVTINPGNMPAGTYHGSISLALMDPSGGTTPVSVKQVPVALYIDEPASPQITSIQQAASFLSTPLSPGLIFSVFGSGLGPVTPVAGDIQADQILSQSLGGVEVLVNGIPCPLLYVSSTQINAIAPYSLFNKNSASIVVRNMGVLSDPVPVPVSVAVPGLFSEPPLGAGFGAILNQDQTVNTASNPAAKGSIVSLFATGEGQTNPQGIDGQITSPNLLPQPLLPVSVTIGGIPATDITFTGSAPNLTAGAFQINVHIPASVPSGNVPVLLKVGTSISQGSITVAVR